MDAVFALARKFSPWVALILGMALSYLLVSDSSQDLIDLRSTATFAALIAGLTLCGLLLLLLHLHYRAGRMAQDLTAELRAQQEQLAASEFRWKFALEGSGDGIWDFDIASNTVIYSDRCKELLGYRSDEIGDTLSEWETRIHPADREHALASLQACLAGKDLHVTIEHRVLGKDGSYHWILIRGMVVTRDSGGKPLRMLGTLHDLNDRKLAQARVEQLGRLYATRSACSAAIVHCQWPGELFHTVCEVVVRYGKMQLAWIGLLDEASGRIVPAHWAGEGAPFLEDIEMTIHADDPHGNGATGTAVRENRTVWIQDFRNDPRTLPWQQRAARYGWVSSAALPISRGGKPIGALTFYSTDSDWITDEVRALVEEMARDISFALDKFEAEAVIRSKQATLIEAEQRFRSLVEQSFVGAFIIQNNRFVYVNPHMETILGYPHDGTLIKQIPDAIVAEKDLAGVQSLIRKLHAGLPDYHLEHVFTATRLDGSCVEVGTSLANTTFQQQEAIVGLLQDMSNRTVAEAQVKRYASHLEKVFLQTVGMATNLVEMRDPYTAGHEKNVAEIALALGAELHLSADQLEGLRVGGYLHDIGKVTVPAEILSKAGRISAAEYALIKGHPRAGYDILKDVDFPWPVAQIALQHHERMDGSGYPQGLKGTDILYEARIIAVADVVESMSSHRPYRAALGLKRALAEIEQGRGTKYDAGVVDAALCMFSKQGFGLPL